MADFRRAKVVKTATIYAESTAATKHHTDMNVVGNSQDVTRTDARMSTPNMRIWRVEEIISADTMMSAYMYFRTERLT